MAVEAPHNTFESPPEHEDETFYDSDSALGDVNIPCSTKSLTSTVFDYPEENDRTYHAFHPGSYWGPNDHDANNHLDLGHALFDLTLDGKLFLAPIPPDPKEILDLGTGTGIWAIDFADAYPECKVIGTDLSPIQPEWTPRNCYFEINDFHDRWVFGAERFDFIHLRISRACVRDRSKFYAQCLHALKPGGYFEQVEYSPWFTSEDHTVGADSAIAQWNKMADFVATTLPDGEFDICSRMKDFFERAGFEDIHEEKYAWPLGPWPRDSKLKQRGLWGREHAVTGLEDWVLRLLTQRGWSADRVKTLCAGVEDQMYQPGVHALHEMKVVYGRKPWL